VVELLIGPAAAGVITAGIAVAGATIKKGRDERQAAQQQYEKRYEALNTFVQQQHQLSIEREQAMEVALTRVGTGLEHVVEALKQSSIEAREDRREIYARLGRVENRVSSVETHLEIALPRMSRTGHSTSPTET
jgi:uncharacterized protein HemX